MGDEKLQPPVRPTAGGDARGLPRAMAVPAIPPTPLAPGVLPVPVAAPVRVSELAPTSGARPSPGRLTLPGGVLPPGPGELLPEASPPARRSSRPPPLPPEGFTTDPSFPALPRPPHDDGSADAAPVLFEDAPEDGTPVPTTLPSASIDPAAQLSESPLPGPPVHVMPTIAVGDPDAPPLGPPGDLELELPQIDALGGPPPSSRPPTSIAPNMPQIPKPISSRKPAELAPGIVSTQAIPLTTPVRRPSRAPLFVALTFALIGGAIAFLLIRPADPGERLAVRLVRRGFVVGGAGRFGRSSACEHCCGAVASEAPSAHRPPSLLRRAPAASSATAFRRHRRSHSPRGRRAPVAGRRAHPSVAPASTTARPKRTSDRIED
ncbi:MAG: hypothetical protein R3B70_07715 [Polyangiaceae bacterium]